MRKILLFSFLFLFIATIYAGMECTDTECHFVPDRTTKIIVVYSKKSEMKLVNKVSDYLFCEKSDVKNLRIFPSTKYIINFSGKKIEKKGIEILNVKKNAIVIKKKKFLLTDDKSLKSLKNLLENE